MNSFSAGGLEASDDLSGALNGKKPHARQAALPWGMGTSREQALAAGDRRTAGDVWESDVVVANPEPDDSPLDISRLRILEIGSGYFKLSVSGADHLPVVGDHGCRRISQPIDGFSTPDRIWRELRAAGEGAYDVIDRQHLRYSPWHPRYWARAPVLHAAPSLGVADAAIRRQHAALG